MVKLNLGAGNFKPPGWVSVDIVPEFEPDLLEDITNLPSFEPGSVDSLFAGHCIEHLADPMAALLRWFEILRPGGDITLSCPDHQAAVTLWMTAQPFPVLTAQPLTGLLAVTTGFYSFAQYQQAKAQNPLAAQAQTHRRSIDLPVLSALMQAAGFVGLEKIDETQAECAPKFNELVSWQLVVRGFKPSNENEKEIVAGLVDAFESYGKSKSELGRIGLKALGKAELRKRRVKK